MSVKGHAHKLGFLLWSYHEQRISSLHKHPKGMIFYIALTGPKDNNQSVKKVSLQKRGGTQWGNESENQRIKCNWLDSQVINLLSKCWTAYAWNVISQLTSQLGCHAVHLCCQNYERQYFAPSYHCRTTVTQGTHVFLINNLWTCAKPLFWLATHNRGNHSLSEPLSKPLFRLSWNTQSTVIATTEN